MLSLKQDTEGIETVMKKGKLHFDGEKEEFQLQLAKECFDNGIMYWGDAQWDMSLGEFRRSLEIREDILGKLNDDTAKGYLWVGSLCWHKMEYGRALDFFSRSFRIRMELSSGAKEQCGIVTNWINKALEGQGIENKTIYWKAFLRCIDRERKGDKLRSQGKFEAAMQEYRSSLQLEFSRRGMNVNTPVRPLPDAADIYTKIARLYVAQGDYPRAMMEYRQALRIYMAAFGRHRFRDVRLVVLPDAARPVGNEVVAAPLRIELMPIVQGRDDCGVHLVDDPLARKRLAGPKHAGEGEGGGMEVLRPGPASFRRAGTGRFQVARQNAERFIAGANPPIAIFARRPQRFRPIGRDVDRDWVVQVQAV